MSCVLTIRIYVIFYFLACASPNFVELYRRKKDPYFLKKLEAIVETVWALQNELRYINMRDLLNLSSIR